MRARFAILILSAGFLVCQGCGPAPEPVEAKIQAKPEYALTDLLTKPRAELAELAAEISTRVQMQTHAAREGTLNFSFLPDLVMSPAVPVWNQAAYSAKLGISLPPY